MVLDSLWNLDFTTDKQHVADNGSGREAVRGAHISRKVGTASKIRRTIFTSDSGLRFLNFITRIISVSPHERDFNLGGFQNNIHYASPQIYLVSGKSSKAVRSNLAGAEAVGNA